MLLTMFFKMQNILPMMHLLDVNSPPQNGMDWIHLKKLVVQEHIIVPITKKNITEDKLIEND